MSDKDVTHEARESDSGESFGFTDPRFDVEEYKKMLGDVDIPEEQQRDFLAVLWKIMVSFADLGFGIDPVQMILDKSKSEIEKSDMNAAFLAASIAKRKSKDMGAGSIFPDAKEKE